jgi:hypothetical protein
MTGVRLEETSLTKRLLYEFGGLGVAGDVGDASSK